MQITIPTALLVLGTIVVTFIWCIAQCVGSKPKPGKQPFPCGSCRNPENHKTVIFCRICYFLLAGLVIFSLVVSAIGGILLNNGVQKFFTNSAQTVGWFVNTIKDLNNILNVGESFLNSTGAIPDYIDNEGYHIPLIGNATYIHELTITATELHNMFNTSAAPTTYVTFFSEDNRQHLREAVENYSALSGMIVNKQKENQTLQVLCDDTEKIVLPMHQRLVRLATALTNFSSGQPLNSLDEYFDTSLTNFVNNVATLTDTTLNDTLHRAITSLQQFNSGYAATDSSTRQSMKEDLIALIQKTGQFLDIVDRLRTSDGFMCQLFPRPLPVVLSDISDSVETTLAYTAARQNALSTRRSLSLPAHATRTRSLSLLSAPPNQEDVDRLDSIIDELTSVAAPSSVSFPAPTVAPDDVGLTELADELSFLTDANNNIDVVIEDIDELFYGAANTLYRAELYLEDFQGFLGEYLSIYKEHGNSIFILLAVVLGIIALLVALTFLCTFCSSVSDLLCCSIGFQLFFLFFLSLIAAATCLFGFGFLDVYTDFYQSDTSSFLKTFRPVFDYIVDLTKPPGSLNTTDTGTEEQRVNDGTKTSKFTAPTYNELLPFVQLNGTLVAEYYFRYHSKKPPTNPVDFFLTITEDSFTKSVVHPMKNPETIFTHPIQASVTDKMKEVDDSLKLLQEFHTNQTEKLSQRTVLPYLRLFLDPIFLTCGHSIAVLFGGAFLSVFLGLIGNCVLMCGRDLWVGVPESKQNKKGKQANGKTAQSGTRSNGKRPIPQATLQSIRTTQSRMYPSFVPDYAQGYPQSTSPYIPTNYGPAYPQHSRLPRRTPRRSRQPAVPMQQSDYYDDPY